jgi:hypothetical protein
MVEHLAAIVVITLAVSTVVMISRYHSELVEPARLDALAQQAALNAVRVQRADGTMQTNEHLGAYHFVTQVHGQEVDVKLVARHKKWRFSTGVHSN